MASVTMQSIVKAFGKKSIIQGLDLTIADGEFVVVVGPSGCGKSTLLRLVAGLEPLTDGTIAIDGRDVSDLEPKDRDIAMVFQDYALYPHKNVYENIAFGLRMRRIPEATIDATVRSAARRLNLEAFLERKPGALSGGQRQRVAIGRAIVRNPKLFLFDEPLSNLDAKLRGTMRVEIAKLHRELKATILYVTHDQVEAMTLADRIVVLEAGRIQQAGRPLDLYYHPSNTFVATFLGSPPMNLLPAQIGSGGNAGAPVTIKTMSGLTFTPPPDLQKAKLKELPVGRDVLWGLRPENLRIPEPGVTGGTGRFKAEVIVTEPLGPHTVAHVTIGAIGSDDLTVALPAPHRPQRGGIIELEFASKHLYLFDARTGLALV